MSTYSVLTQLMNSENHSVYIPGWVPKEGADQLAQVLTDTSSAPRCCPIMFQDCFHNTSAKKTTTITSLNYYLPPAALTPIVMKCFERLVKAHIISKGPSTPPITTTTPATKAKHSNTQSTASDWETVQKVVRTAEKKSFYFIQDIAWCQTLTTCPHQGLF